MTRRPPDSPRPPRHRAAAGVALVAVALTGCSRSDDAGRDTLPATESVTTAGLEPTASAAATSTSPSVPTEAPSRDTTAAPAPAPTPPAASSAPPTTVVLDAPLLLTNALDALRAGYHFATTATIGGNVAVAAEGDHIAGSTHMAVTSGGTSTEYLITADAAWALADGVWQQLDSAEGLSDPIGQLRNPLAATATGTPEAATVVAQYPAAALGLPGDGEAAVEFHLADGRITSLRYASIAQVSGPDGVVTEQAAEVTAVITPVAPGTEITLPTV